MVNIRRKRRRQSWGEGLTPDAIAWLRGLDPSFPYFADRDGYANFGTGAELWATYVGDVLAEHVVENPGTRPCNWWNFTAPEMRRRLGGVGDPAGAGDNYGEGLGIPPLNAWRDQRDAAVDDPCGIGFSGWPKGRRPIDYRNPPKFESQGAYLRRLGLFLPGEEDRVGAAAFEPEIIVVPWPGAA
jgi:hypothetical protein